MLPIFTLFILLFIVLNSRKISFIDIYLLYSLYFDATIVFAGNQRVNYVYVRAAVFIAFIIYYFAKKMAKINHLEKRILYPVLLFLAASFLFPLLKGVGLNQNLRIFLPYYFSMLILPVAFHHYSTSGDIRNLFKTCGYFMITWVLLVGLFTIFRIDSIRGGHLGSQSFGMGIVFFGDMAAHGAISYMALFMLLIPVILPYTKSVVRVLFVISCVFIAAILIVALKRFSLIALFLGAINYLLSVKIRTRYKAVFIGVGLSLLIPLFIFTDLGSIAEQQYYRRKGTEKYSIEAVSQDVRFFEPFHAAVYTFKGGLQSILIGRQTDNIMDIVSDEYYMIDRNVHNQYAQYILIFGFTGLIFYLLIFARVYWITQKIKNRVLNNPYYDIKQWIAFQNVVLIYFAGGVSGGHAHITYRGLVLIIAGAICGHFYKLMKNDSMAVTKN